MDELKRYAKKMSSSISDPLERKEAEKEIYSNLLEAYEEHREISSNEEEALQLTLDKFGRVDEVGDELKQAHIKRINKKSLLFITDNRP
ncbi:hypothetical protein ACS127_01020 [Amphibacillus sp. Q70]|uniref:hypothetical protein n=1 Tax=Amphibacillus sp. Q70 TaxID=3453416 RepID=UPI003F84F918